MSDRRGPADDDIQRARNASFTLADASAAAQIVGVVLVLASLVFVGLQMRQNTKAVRASTSQAHAASYQDLVGRVYESAELTEIWTKGFTTPEALSDNERMRFLLIMAATFRFWDATFNQYRDGQLPEAHWKSMERMILDGGLTPGVKMFWELRKSTLSPEFRAWYDAQRFAPSEAFPPAAEAEPETREPGP